MKKTKIKPVAAPQTPVFQIAIRKRGAKATGPDPKPDKRENIFSKSRDSREDRGTREMKTSHNVQTFPHSHNF